MAVFFGEERSERKLYSKELPAVSKRIRTRDESIESMGGEVGEEAKTSAAHRELPTAEH